MEQAGILLVPTVESVNNISYPPIIVLNCTTLGNKISTYLQTASSQKRERFKTASYCQYF